MSASAKAAGDEDGVTGTPDEGGPEPLVARAGDDGGVPTHPDIQEKSVTLGSQVPASVQSGRRALPQGPASAVWLK